MRLQGRASQLAASEASTKRYRERYLCAVREHTHTKTANAALQGRLDNASNSKREALSR